ncbi:alpha/beta hydrolase [Nocardioides sp. AX2bis]|uniref:alpha/beta hydrolase n=1 Tax=Nocardioides sp. AX2bis TaxID=2653157 RepID=UPI0012F35B70|nr:alpha/beta hydrolase [Nocardioides sp. AX2bis]VXB67265.1 Alpha/beta hydrolase [Nocardioides sp. AX2bis]
MPLDPGTQSLLDLITAAGYPPMHEGTPATARQAMRSMTIDLVTDDNRVPVGDVAEVDAGGVPARLYRPEGDGPWPTLVWIHGGGWVVGDLDTYDQTCRRFCRDGQMAVLSVDYRLAPEAPFPAAVEDSLTAVRWALAHRAELGGSDLVAVGGDSAGGNLSAIAAQELSGELAAQVLIYPSTDMAGDYPSRAENAEGYFLDLATMVWFSGHYLSGGERLDLADPRLSPIAGTVAGVAPAVVVTAEYDPLRDEGEAYADALTAAGVDVDRTRYDGLVHGFLDMGAMSPAADAALDDVIARTKALLDRLA